MKDMNIQRNAHVYTPEGAFGEVKHVILDHQTREVLDLVVEHDECEYLVPMSAVTEVAGDRVRLAGARSEYVGNRFQHAQYHEVDDEQARRQSSGEAVNGGAPLLDAKNDAVEVGAPAAAGMQTAEMPLHSERDYCLQARPEYRPRDEADQVRLYRP